MNFELEHVLYVAGEIEKLLISEKAIEYSNEAINYLSRNSTDALIRPASVDVTSHMDSMSEIIDLIPSSFPVSMLRQRNGDRLLWTVSITRSATELATIMNSSAGRSRSRNHAALASIIRSYVQEVRSNEAK